MLDRDCFVSKVSAGNLALVVNAESHSIVAAGIGKGCIRAAVIDEPIHFCGCVHERTDNHVIIVNVRGNTYNGTGR